MIATLTLLTPLTLTAVLLLAGAILAGFGLLRWWSGPPAGAARRWGLRGLRAASIATLVLILLNPSYVTQTPGPIERPDIFYLLDTSQSMSVGDSETRFDHAVRLMREAEQIAGDTPHAARKLFRFGHRLTAIDDVSQLGLSNEAKLADGHSAKIRAQGPRDGTSRKPLLPTDSDTQLLTALRQVSSRFGRRPPAGIVVFSDGRARDESGVEPLAEQFARLKAPVHVVPVGDLGRGGDVAIVAVVAPPRVRRFTEVEVQVFLRSYGYEGRRCEVSLTAPGDPEHPEVDRKLAPPVPITLHDGFQSVGLSFRSDARTRKLQIDVSTQPGEVSTANNRFHTEVGIDRTKIRVLYVEGSSQPLQPVQRGAKYEVRGPYTDLQQALIEDEDIECVVLSSAGGQGRLTRVTDAGGITTARGFPETVAELAAFDAMILSDVAADALTDQQLVWIENWIGQRGGGLLMVGGQRSFASGNWDGTPLAQMLPVDLRPDADWMPGTQVEVRPAPAAAAHPVWSIVTDARQNAEILGAFPSFFAANRWLGVKPHLTTVLATLTLDTDAQNEPSRSLVPGSKPDVAPAGQPAIVAGRYGRGRTMAMAMPITPPWANDLLTKWGEGDRRYYGKFWRNTIYWLTESSSIGRRRLVVSADKKFYRPGEPIRLTASAFDEAATPTGNYRITGMIEPQSSLSELESNDSPIRWPEGKPRESGETGPLIAWGEEFELPRADLSDGRPAFALTLPVADALLVGSASQSLRIEMTAMEDFTQVDSTSLDLQILHDPFEQQNPFPNHELLQRLASGSGGRIIRDSNQLADVLKDVTLTVGAPVIHQSPVWSTWWLWTWLLGLLTVEWLWRRMVGLA